MFKKLFLPVGMVTAVLFSFLLPGPGIMLKKALGSSFFIVLIFLVCGWQTKFREMKLDRKFLTAFLFCGVVTLCVAPWLGVLTARCLALDAFAMTGLVVMASVPPTLSSGIVMTETSEGNVMLGVIMTVFYNLIGVFTMPLMLTWCLASKAEIRTDPLGMFLQLLLLVILPFAAGAAGKRLTKKDLPSVCGYIPSLCVIILILFFFSGANAQFRSYPVKVLCFAGIAGLFLRITLMLLIWFGGRLLRMPVPDRKAAIFTAGSKTLTIALTLLAILKIGDGPAVIPCMVFYFLQSMIDSALAGKMGLSAAKARNLPEK